jgi:hypothetical protein
VVTEVTTSREELLEAFRGQAPAALADFARRHGLELRPAEDESFVLESPRCRVRVRFGSGHVPDLNVTLFPPAGRSERGDQEFGLGPILEATADPRVAYSPRPLRTAEDVRQELERAMALLESHCSHVLGGDFTAWPALQRMTEDAARDWKRQFKEGGREARLWQTREAARMAYGQGDHRKAAALYESIAEDLTPAEKLRLDHARSQG